MHHPERGLMTATLVVTRGLPGSGKTTWAREWVAADHALRSRVNRDDLRAMLQDRYFEKGVTEGRVIAVRDRAIQALLMAGISVVSDDTNLIQRGVRDLAAIAHSAKAVIKFQDFTHVPLETCLERNLHREDKLPVPASVIQDMHGRYLHGKTLPLPDPDDIPVFGEIELYVPDASKPSAIICDIDGTVAIRGDRDIYDEGKVHLDTPNQAVIGLVRDAISLGDTALFTSGRSEGCRAATKMWLDEYVVSLNHYRPNPHMLFMRPADDKRKDYIVKLELFNKNIRDAYNVRYALDDRNQVVNMWRELGLTCLQVAEGNF
jgi:predicted kinase